jgi:HEAT repeat protein
VRLKAIFLAFWVGVASPSLLPRATAAEEKSVDELAREIHALKPQYMEQAKRATAMRALGRKKTLPAAKILSTLLGDPYLHIRELAVKLLGEMESEEVASFLSKRCLADRNPDVRRNAAEALGLLAKDVASDRLVKALADRDPRVATMAAKSLGRIGDVEAAAGIRKRLSSTRGGPKGEAVRTLGVLGRLPDSKTLENLFKESRWEIRVGVLDGLAAAGDDRVRGFAARGLEDKAFQVRIAAVEALVKVAVAKGGAFENAALRGVESGLKDERWVVRAASAHATVDFWRLGCIPLLVEAMGREEKAGGGRLLIDFRQILHLYTGKSIGFDAELWASWWRAQKGKFKLGKRPKANRYGVIQGLSGAPEADKSVVKFYSLPILSRRVAFVFDFSGSMRNDATDGGDARPKIDIARDKMKETLFKFRRDQWFNVLVYRYYSSYPPETKTERAFVARLMPADKMRKTEAADFLDLLKPLGWGCFYESILEAMAIPEVDTIYFLSDGKPSRGRYVTTKGLFDRLRVVNRFRRVMIHTVLTGVKGADERFMRDLARLTWGMTTKG